jgi:ABC-2 type transport system permease protein
MTRRQALSIARVKFRRLVRTGREKPWLALIQVFTLATGIAIVVGRVPVPGLEALMHGPGGYVYGQRLAAGETAAVRETVAGVAGIGVVFVALVTVLQTYTAYATRESTADAQLLAVSVETYAASQLLVFAGFVGAFVLPVVVAGGVALAVGAGDPLLAPAVVAAGLGVVALGTAAGFVGGLAILRAFQTLPRARNHPLAVGGPLAAVYFALFVESRRAGALLGATPLGWYGDLALAPSGAGTLETAAIAAVATLPLSVLLGAVGVRLGSSVWLADPPEGDDAERDAEGRSLATRLLRATCRRPTAAVVRANWLRLRRAPKALFFMAMPIVIVGSTSADLARAIPGSVPMVVAIYGGLAVGMGVTLNPLGNEGAVLPVTVLAPGGERRLVHGYVLAMALPGVPLVAAATLVAGLWFTTLPPAVVLATVLVGVVVALTGTVVSLAIGGALPNYDGIDPTDSAATKMPKPRAAAVYALAMSLLAGPAFAGLYAPASVGGGVVAAAVGVAATLVLCAAVGRLSYRRAVRLFRTHEL